MPDLIRSKTVTARKTRYCECCFAVAATPGQAYRRLTYAYDGRIYDCVTCKPCEGMVGDVYDWAGRPEEGVGGDELAEWSEYHPDDERAQAFVARVAAAREEWRRGHETHS